MRSLRQGAPVLIWPAFNATTRSAMVLSSVSPERCDTTTVQPARCDMRDASIDSVNVPIWLTLHSSELQAFSLIARSTNLTLVTRRSSPTSGILLPTFWNSSFQPSQSSWAMPSSSEMIGYWLIAFTYQSTISALLSVLPSLASTYLPSW